MKWFLCLLWALLGSPDGDLAFATFVATREVGKRSKPNRR